MTSCRVYHYTGNHVAGKVADEMADAAQLPPAILDEIKQVDLLAWQVQKRIFAIILHVIKEEQAPKYGKKKATRKRNTRDVKLWLFRQQGHEIQPKGKKWQCILCR